MIIDDYFSKMPAELLSGDEVPELKLLKTFAFNAFFSADNVRVDDCKNATCYSRESKFGIDGVYLNDTLEENAIECVYSYYVQGDTFNLVDVFKAFDYICAQIDEVRLQHLTTKDESDKLLADQIREFEEADEKVNIIIRVITNYVCDEKTRYEILKKVETHNVAVKTYKVTPQISFGDDIVAVVDSNIAPYDYVADGKLIVDDQKNVLKYGNDSFVCNIKAQSLKKLWASDGQKGLLAMNLRYYIKSANIDGKIEDSILFNGDNFWYLNNGIIIVCDDYCFVGDELRLKNFSIVNGGQTTRMIGTIPFENDFLITCKVVKNTFETDEKKNIFISQVAEASNTQKPINAKDIIANKVEQRNLKALLGENKIFVEIKRGDKYDHSLYVEPWQHTKNNELAQDLYSFVYMEPGPARNNVSKLLQNDEKYKLIFANHTYLPKFLKDVLMLEKAYREYSKLIGKDENVDPIKKGLVKNGMFYTLATIGYIAKLYYNTEYFQNMYKYRNTEVLYNLYSPEVAFVNGFISSKKTYAEFKKEAFEIFDFVFTNLIVNQFKLARDINPTLAYSNWTKTNTGFNGIRTMINAITMDSKQSYIIDGVMKYFLPTSEEQNNINIDTYVDYCKANKKIVAKTTDGHELDENDKQLRDELMIYRQNYSLNKHVPEKNVYTDKMIDKLIVEKPLIIADLKKIISAQSAYYCGEEIIKIIEKYI